MTDIPNPYGQRAGQGMGMYLTEPAKPTLSLITIIRSHPSNGYFFTWEKGRILDEYQ
jgi:hypothetical protein